MVPYVLGKPVSSRVSDTLTLEVSKQAAARAQAAQPTILGYRSTNGGRANFSLGLRKIRVGRVQESAGPDI